MLRFLVSIVLLLGGLVAQRYTISSDPWIAWAPVWVAQEKGLWRQHGIEVEVVAYDGNDAAASLAAGKVDFCMAMAGTAVGMRVEQRQDVVVLAEVDWSHGGDKLLLQQGLELGGLRGKRVGVYEESPAVLMYLAAELATVGLSVKDVELISIDDPEALASQVAAGRLPAAVLYEPFVAPALRGGAARVVGSTADFPGVMPECVLARRERLAKMPPAHIVALLQGWIDAVEWARQPANEAEFLRLCVEHAFGSEKVSINDARRMLTNVRLHDQAMLRERNLGGEGIRAWLDRAVAFALARSPAPSTPRPELGPLFEPRWLREALGAAVATPAK